VSEIDWMLTRLAKVKIRWYWSRERRWQYHLQMQLLGMLGEADGLSSGAMRKIYFALDKTYGQGNSPVFHEALDGINTYRSMICRLLRVRRREVE